MWTSIEKLRESSAREREGAARLPLIGFHSDEGEYWIAIEQEKDDGHPYAELFLTKEEFIILALIGHQTQWATDNQPGRDLGIGYGNWISSVEIADHETVQSTPRQVTTLVNRVIKKLEETHIEYLQEKVSLAEMFPNLILKKRLGGYGKEPTGPFHFRFRARCFSSSAETVSLSTVKQE